MKELGRGLVADDSSSLGLWLLYYLIGLSGDVLYSVLAHLLPLLEFGLHGVPQIQASVLALT